MLLSKTSWQMGKTCCETRFGEPFKGPVSPIVSMIEYHPISATDHSRLHQFGSEVLPGIFPGCALYVERIWKGDIVVADVEELENFGRQKSTLGDSMRRRF